MVGEEEALAGFPSTKTMGRRPDGKTGGGRTEEEEEDLQAAALRPLEELYAQLLEAVQVWDAVHIAYNLHEAVPSPYLLPDEAMIP